MSTINNPFAKSGTSYNYDQLDDDVDNSPNGIQMDDFDDDDAGFGLEDFKADSPSQPAFTMNDTSPASPPPVTVTPAQPFKKNTIGAMALKPPIPK